MEKIKAFYGENRNIVLGIVGVVVIIVLVLGGRAFFASDKTTDMSVVEDEGQNNTPTHFVAPIKGVKATNTNEVKISYADALLKYKNSTIQFNDKCESLTFKYVYKNGTDVLIDNRGLEKVFSIGDNKLTIAAYDFAIVKLSSNTLPKTITIDCGSRQNVSEITIQN